MSKFATIFVLIFLISCQENKSGSKKHLRDSSGKINALTIVVDNQLWKGELGDSLRATFAYPVDGLPMDEPLFNMKQYDPSIFKDFVTSGRLVVYAMKGKSNYVSIKENVYAKPQMVAYVSGLTISDITTQLHQNKDKIIHALKTFETKENQRRIKKSTKDNKFLKDKFNLTMDVSKAYVTAKDEKGFLWLRKETPQGHTHIMLYEAPINYLDDKNKIIENVVRKRDSLSVLYVEGALKGTFMVVDQAYAPYLFETKINNAFAYETKGTWELKNDFMVGPFVNYAIYDKKNNRIIFADGFCYNPQANKRDLIFELEATIKSIKLL
jgi:hypothetical protein